MNLAHNAALSPDGDDLFHEIIAFQRHAVLGAKTTKIIRVYDASARLLDVYNRGGPFKISATTSGHQSNAVSAHIRTVTAAAARRALARAS